MKKVIVSQRITVDPETGETRDLLGAGPYDRGGLSMDLRLSCMDWAQ